MRPLRVDYALTEAGAALLDPIRAMGARAARYAEVVVAPQQRRAPDPSGCDGPGGPGTGAVLTSRDRDISC